MVKVKVELVIKYPGRGDYRNNAEALLNSWLEGNLKRITKALESASYTTTK